MGNKLVSVAGDNPLLKCEASGGSQAWSVEECNAFDHAAARTPEAFLNITLTGYAIGVEDVPTVPVEAWDYCKAIKESQ